MSTDDLQQNEGQSTLDDLLSEQITNLRNCDDYSSTDAKVAYEALIAIREYTGNNEYNTEKVAAKLAEHSYGSLFVTMWKSLVGFVVIKESKGYQNLRLMLKSYRNLSDISFELAAELGETGCIPLLVDALDSLRDCYSDTSDIIQLILRILFNALHKFDDNYSVYRKANTVEILKRYLDCNDNGVTLNCLLIMAYVVGEAESAKLQTDNGYIGVIVAALQEAVESEDHHETSPCRFSAGELLCSLNKCAHNDVNKVVIVKNGGIPLVNKMLQDDFDEQDNVEAVTMVLNLAFVEAIRKSAPLQGTFEAMEKLDISNNQYLKEVRAYAIWILKGRRPAFSKPDNTGQNKFVEESKPEEGQLMISFEWDSYDQAIVIRDKIRKAGYNVWMDVSNMSGTALYLMAETVETVAVVLVCTSEKYKNNQKCRAEAEYASILKKCIIPLLMEPDYNLDGWLRKLLGTKTFHLFQTAEKMESNMDILLKEIACTVTPSREKVDGQTISSSSASNIKIQELDAKTKEKPSSSLCQII